MLKVEPPMFIGISWVLDPQYVLPRMRAIGYIQGRR